MIEYFLNNRQAKTPTGIHGFHLGQPGWVSGGPVGIEGPILATLIFVGAIGWIFFSMKPALVKAEEVEAAA